MRFESEPLLAAKFDVSVSGETVAIAVHGKKSVYVKATDLHKIEFKEFAATLQTVAKILGTFTTPPAPKQLARLVRQRRPGTSFHSIYYVMERLIDLGIIRGEDARRFVEIMADDYRWRRSYFSQPLAEWRIKTPYLGPAGNVPFLIVCGLLIAAGLGAAMIMGLRTVSDSAAASALPLRWALQALITLSLTRLISGMVQTLLVAWQTGRVQTLKIQINLAGLAADWNRSQPPTLGPAVWIACAAMASIPVAGLVSLPEAEMVAKACTAFAFIAELSPFTRSRLVDILRLAYSGDSLPAKSSVANFHVLAGALWITVAGLAWFGFVSAFRMGFQSAAANDPGGSALFLWFGLVIAVAWIEDILKGAHLGMETDPQRIRKIFFWRATRGSSKTASERLANPDSWHTLPLLRQLDAGLRKTVLKHAQPQRFKRGQRICKQGEKTRQLYILLSGEAAVVHRDRRGKGSVVAILEENSVFGETGFFLNLPRTADVVAISPCTALALSPDQKGMVELGKFSELQKRIWLLQAIHSIGTFRDVPMEAMDELLLAGRTQSFQAKTAIMRQGEPARGCYIIIQGTARVVQDGVEINRVAAGDVIGEIALFRESERTASVVAETDLLCVELDREDFLEFSCRHLAFAMTMERQAWIHLERDRTRKSKASA